MKSLKIIIILIICCFIIMVMQNAPIVFSTTTDCEVDLTNLKYTIKGIESNIKNYTQDEFEKFVIDFNNGNLPEIYTTEFLYDGVGMVKTPDLDDFIEEDSNDIKIKTLSIKAINVNTTGNIQFSGEITGGMIAVNTNEITGDINLILNGVNIDTDSKKTPAIYVYNKNVNYTDYKVTIKTVSETQNYIEGGKFKKVSLIGSDEISDYAQYYSIIYYNTYTNYYGIYTKDQIDNILFAKVQADSEQLRDGDPYYFYKGAGAISSDIDLYFEGEGYLSVISKNKEGIETKGNLTFAGGTGDYYIFAEDDCLNTTTTSQDGSSARNTLTIDVNSLIAKVSTKCAEGDAIDSNGLLIINGGLIFALGHPMNQDAGFDSLEGTYINGGTVVAMGNNKEDRVEDSSTQDFITLNFTNQQKAETLMCVTDANNKPVIAFKSDRTFTTLTLSTPDISKQTYHIYKGGTITGTEGNGLYTSIESYTSGTQQQWLNSNRGEQGANNNENQQNNKPSIEFTISAQKHTFSNVTDFTGSTRN